MNPKFIPGIIDIANQLEAAITKTASYQGAGLDLGSGFGPVGIGQPMAAVPTITAMDETSGNETYAFTLMESPDNATWVACGPTVTLTAAAASALGAYAIPGFVSQRYISLGLVAGGTTPSITYTTDLVVMGVGA